jgi:putative copper export protein
MTTQNYQNHVRFSPAFHFVAIPLIVIGEGIAIYNFCNTPNLTNGLLVFAFALFLTLALFARWFGLRNQDRAARADERLRYYILTQKMLPANLGMGQIIALRFAGDEEMAALVERAVQEKLSSKEIKQAIKNWRGDYHRI